MARTIAGLVLAILALLMLLVWSQWRAQPLVVSGFIEADEIRLGSRVGGRVQAVHVQEGQHVTVGQPLIALAPFDLQERKVQAQAELAARTTRWQQMQTGFRREEIAQAKAARDQQAAVLARLQAGPRVQEIAAARALVQQAQAQVQLAQITFSQVKEVFERKAATQIEFDRAAKQLQAAQAALEANRQQLSLLEEGTRPEDIAQAQARLEEAQQAWQFRVNGYSQEDIAQAKAAVDSAAAALAAIDRQLEELTIVAPVDGSIESLDLQPGDLVPPNAPVLSLVDNRNLWVRAYVPENHLNLAIDQTVPVTVDSFPSRPFRGRITFIARQAEFTPGNVQTPEERSKQVFRIKVTLEEGLDVLRPGMAADVHLSAVAPARSTTQPASHSTSSVPTTQP